MKIFNRNDPETVNNALYKSLPEFKNIYKDSTTADVLQDAYYEIRSKVSSGKTKQQNSEEETSSDTEKSLLTLDGKLQPNVEFDKTSEVKTETKSTTTVKVDAVLGKKPRKSELIAKYLLEGLSSKEVITKLAEEGVSTTKPWVDEIAIRIKEGRKI